MCKLSVVWFLNECLIGNFFLLLLINIIVFESGEKKERKKRKEREREKERDQTYQNDSPFKMIAYLCVLFIYFLSQPNLLMSWPIFVFSLSMIPWLFSWRFAGIMNVSVLTLFDSSSSLVLESASSCSLSLSISSSSVRRYALIILLIALNLYLKFKFKKKWRRINFYFISNNKNNKIK